MYKIASRKDCNNIVAGTYSSDLNRCPIYSELSSNKNFVITGNYADNQLIRLSSISKYIEVTTNIRTASISCTADNITASIDLSLPMDAAANMGVVIGVYNDTNPSGSSITTFIVSGTMEVGTTNLTITQSHSIKAYKFFKILSISTMGNYTGTYTFENQFSSSFIVVPGTGGTPDVPKKVKYIQYSSNVDDTHNIAITLYYSHTINQFPSDLSGSISVSALDVNGNTVRVSFATVAYSSGLVYINNNVYVYNGGINLSDNTSILIYSSIPSSVVPQLRTITSVDARLGCDGYDSVELAEVE